MPLLWLCTTLWPRSKHSTAIRICQALSLTGMATQLQPQEASIAMETQLNIQPPSTSALMSVEKASSIFAQTMLTTASADTTNKNAAQDTSSILSVDSVFVLLSFAHRLKNGTMNLAHVSALLTWSAQMLTVVHISGTTKTVNASVFLNQTLAARRRPGRWTTALALL